MRTSNLSSLQQNKSNFESNLSTVKPNSCQVGKELSTVEQQGDRMVAWLGQVALTT